jgi:hypothetical protein
MNEQGMDKEVKKYFRKILYTISWGLIWMIVSITLGIYHKLAFTGSHPVIYTILFYFFFTASLAGLMYYYIRTWKNGGR